MELPTGDDIVEIFTIDCSDLLCINLLGVASSLPVPVAALAFFAPITALVQHCAILLMSNQNISLFDVSSIGPPFFLHSRILLSYIFW